MAHGDNRGGNGFVVRVVPRAELRAELTALLRYLRPAMSRTFPVAEAMVAGGGDDAWDLVPRGPGDNGRVMAHG